MRKYMVRTYTAERFNTQFETQSAYGVNETFADEQSAQAFYDEIDLAREYGVEVSSSSVASMRDKTFVKELEVFEFGSDGFAVGETLDLDSYGMDEYMSE